MKKVSILFLVTSMSIIGFGFIDKDSKKKAKNASAAEAPVGINIGNLAPELKFNDPSGKEIALSSLRGKVVLVDFWASWCRPCRYENPNIVAMYNEYKDTKFNETTKGFTVYSVSLDSKKGSWINAIAKDGLIWDNHVSDLGGWGAQGAKIYRVNSIPSGFLINGEGIIVSKGESIRGKGLKKELNRLILK